MPNQGLGTLLLPFLLILLVGFMFWSQRRRQRAAANLQSSIEVGDEVCTTSGLFGRVTAMDTLVMHLEIAPGSVVKFDRRAVAIKVDPNTPTVGPGGSGPATAASADSAVSMSKTTSAPTSGAADEPALPVDEK